jgi:Zn-dependent protease with chaperone function
LFLLAACQQPTTYGPKVTGDELEAERRIQGEMASQAEIDRQQRHSADRIKLEQRLMKVSGPVAKAGAKLCMEMRPSGSDCVFDIRLEPEEDAYGRKKRSVINAYADGEHIYVTPSMMRFLKSDDEIALILSHEYAHNVMAHVDSKRTNAVAGAVFGLLADALVVSQGYQSNGEFMNAGATIGAGSYSVEFEQEADYVGLYIMSQSGYNVKNALNFWRRFSVKEPDMVDISNTHPTNPERFIAMQKTIDEIAYKHKHRAPLIPDYKPES